MKSGCDGGPPSKRVRLPMPRESKRASSKREPKQSEWIPLLSDAVGVAVDRGAKLAGLTAAQARVLFRLDSPRHVGELAELSDCDISSMVTMLQRLERDGLVKRAVDPNDRRAVVVKRTAKGKSVLARFLAGIDQGRRVFEEMPREALEAIASAILDALARSGGAGRQPDLPPELLRDQGRTPTS